MATVYNRGPVRVSCRETGSGAVKRLFSETEDSETDEEEVKPFSRHCQALWNGVLSSYSGLRVLKLKKNSCDAFIDTPLKAFLKLFEDPKIHQFLWIDRCNKIADRYLLAMVFVYFKRANLSLDCYNSFNFYTALHLANDMEEDEDDDKYEIFPWALGNGWMKKYPVLLHNRDKLWKRMGFRAVVSKKTCEEVIALAPNHFIWARYRESHHGGALRNYAKSPIPYYGRSSPLFCENCSNNTDMMGRLFTRSGRGEMDILDEIDLEYRQFHHSKPFQTVYGTDHTAPARPVLSPSLPPPVKTQSVSNNSYTILPSVADIYTTRREE